MCIYIYIDRCVCCHSIGALLPFLLRVQRAYSTRDNVSPVQSQALITSITDLRPVLARKCPTATILCGTMASNGNPSREINPY